MAFEYWLPNEIGQKEKHRTETNAVVIIGANGSGKSKLGAWMEQQDLSKIHRIGGQRNLNFSENIPLKRYSQAEDYVWYGSTDSNGPFKQKKDSDGGGETTKDSRLNYSMTLMMCLLRYLRLRIMKTICLSNSVERLT